MPPPPSTAICVYCCPRWLRPVLTAARVACPIRKRALGVPSARVKFLVTRRAKKRPLFLEKGKLGKNIVFFGGWKCYLVFECMTAILGEGFWWNLPKWRKSFFFISAAAETKKKNFSKYLACRCLLLTSHLCHSINGKITNFLKVSQFKAIFLLNFDE